MALGRPRDPNVVTKTKVCAVHGATEYRGHKSNGVGSIHWRCPACDNDKHKARNRARR